MTAAWSWSCSRAEAGQELQVSIIARQAASGWLQSSSSGELVTAAVISGHWTLRALSDRCTNRERPFSRALARAIKDQRIQAGQKQYSWRRTGGSNPLQTSSAVSRMRSEHRCCVFAPRPMRCHLPNASAASEDMDRPSRVRTSGHPRLRRADVAARGQTSRLAPCCGHPAGVHKA